MPIDTTEYRFDDEPCTLDGSCFPLGYNVNYISQTVFTELYAQAWYPQEIQEKAPLIMLVHGNHASCGIYKGAGQYRKDNGILDYITNDCTSDGYVEVPQHLGYTYLAEHLASQGYIVVSVNHNRGIAGRLIRESGGDSGLNMMRGRSILTHMLLLSQWANGNGPQHPLKVSSQMYPQFHCNT